MTQSISYKQALLIKRTAWMNMQPRKPQPQDERLVPIAVRMLTYVACLNYAMLDLETELSNAGLLRQNIKRSFYIAYEHVQKVHQEAYMMLRKINNKATREYNDHMEWAWRKIENAVLLDAPERGYNIVVALVRLIEKANIELSGRYDFAPSRVLYRITSLLSCAGIEDRQIDRIIEIVITDKSKN